MGAQFQYRLHIDESGVHHMTDECLKKERDRYLGLCGVIFRSDFRESRIRPVMDELRREHFGTGAESKVVFHRDDIVKKRGAFGVLSDPDKRLGFAADMLSFYRSCPIRIVTVVIDKLAHRNKYGEKAYHPYHYCLEAMLERYVIFLRQVGVRGDVIAEKRDKDSNRELSREYRRIYTYGSRFMDGPTMRAVLSSKDLKFGEKEPYEIGLQLADLLAYPTMTDTLLDYGRAIAQSDKFGPEICAAIQRKYLCGRNSGVIRGRGRKLL